MVEGNEGPVGMAFVLVRRARSEWITRGDQGIPVLPQRAASEGEEQGVARLPFVLAEPPR